ncbi:MAG: hypothetical protein FJX46_08235 [Alphaproteobacteria bacterium]|nr:hypothetical protein [Alphaproteobacteria bacterium]
MRQAAAVNADAGKVAVVDVNAMAWEATEWQGIRRKVLEFVSDPRKGRETSILEFAPGAALPVTTLAERLDLFVLEGQLGDEHGSYGPHTFVRNPHGTRHTLRSDKGAVVYMKWRVPIRPQAPGNRIVIDAATAQWMAFPHRGSEVLHLYPNADGIETGRIGHVHVNRKIPSHDHSIGEETLVLKGRLTDEYQSYGPGTWFRMPCGVPHAPFTGDDRCMMLIREGDMVW